MKMEIEIFDRKSNEVVETKKVENLKGFIFYWSTQCNSENYGWRYKK